MLRIRATRLAHLVAEYFRDKGRSVLLLVDSLTRVAHAQREIGLAVGEPPTAKGYPPSVLALLPGLIERSGMGRTQSGSITAIYTVLMDNDDRDDPVVDIARASLDGQIMMSRSLADAAHYPAIDLTGSISRLMPSLVDEQALSMANRFRRLWTLYQQNQDLIKVGAYHTGANADLDDAINCRSEMEKFLRQRPEEAVDFEETFRRMNGLSPQIEASSGG
jgi:flagellum-specific ATP synthase